MSLAKIKRLNNEKRKLVLKLLETRYDLSNEILKHQFNTTRNNIAKWRKEFDEKQEKKNARK